MSERASEREIVVPAEGTELRGIIGEPHNPVGAVLFAHGSGSGRLSPRNAAVARHLQDAGLLTLLVDLLTEPEALDRRNVFDISLLANRLLACTTWLGAEPSTAPLHIGYFGASTGGGAALVAAARSSGTVRAVVSRGGRPDLAGEYLPQVRCPTLLIVGGSDLPVIELNEAARTRLRALTELVIVPGASHLFEEPGTLEEVARLASDWFLAHLPERGGNGPT